jgi:hypothetical protein
MSSTKWFGSGLVAGALALGMLTYCHYHGCAFCGGSPAIEMPTIKPDVKAPDISHIRSYTMQFPNLPEPLDGTVSPDQEAPRAQCGNAPPDGTAQKK